jgi:hypothetical protein
MKNILWRIINKSNELTCIRRLTLLNLNELNLTKRSYQNDYCFVCIFFEKFTFYIQTYKQSRLKKLRTTTLFHVRKTIKKTLKKWRDEKKSSVFWNNFLVQNDNYDLFLNNDMIKNMIKDVHLIKIVNDLWAKMTNWAKDWLNKYDKKLLKLVVVVVIIAKKKIRCEKIHDSTKRRNDSKKLHFLIKWWCHSKEWNRQIFFERNRLFVVWCKNVFR